MKFRNNQIQNEEQRFYSQLSTGTKIQDMIDYDREMLTQKYDDEFSKQTQERRNKRRDRLERKKKYSWTWDD